MYSEALSILREGIRAFAENPWRSIAVIALFLLLSIGVSRGSAAIAANFPHPGFIILAGLLSMLLNAYLLVGLFLFHLAPGAQKKSRKRRTGQIGDLFKGGLKNGKMVWKFLVLQLLSALLLLLFFAPALAAVAAFPRSSWPMALLYLSIPFALWFAVRNSLSGLAVIDRSFGVIESIKASFAWTGGQFWRCSLSLILILIVYLSGAVLLLVGVLATASVASYMYCSLYRSLTDSRPERLR